MSTSAAPLPAPVRIVSGFNSAGASAIVYDAPVPMDVQTKEDGTATGFGQVWATHSSPASNQTGVDEGSVPVEGIVHKGEWVGALPGIVSAVGAVDSGDC